jgi:hypothetical protein
MNDREYLATAIRKLHGCDSKWVAAVPVLERHDGRTVWDGEVQVFDLIGHTTATRCYAWSHLTDEGKDRVLAVLHVAPVDSPAAAVRAAIVSDFRRGRSEKTK